jgi:hypothetical protein
MDRIDVEAELGFDGNRGLLVLRPNSIGKILYALLVPSVSRILERKCRTECSVEATRILIAGALFRLEQGKQPQACGIGSEPPFRGSSGSL